MADPHSLQRFVDAQSPVYPQVLAELRAGRKTSHWMWFVFPQIEGLGASPMAQKFALASLDEARAFLAHPVLGPRLEECTLLLLEVPDRSISEILGYPDDMKLRSSMTLFMRAAKPGSVFEDTLRRFFNNEPDARTLQKLGA